MPKKLFAFLTIFVFSVLALSNFALAADFALTHIGAMSTGGSQYPEWWYMGSSPTFRGTAGSGSEVAVIIDGDQYAVTADSEGNWSYATSLEDGDYSMGFTSGSSSYYFTLHQGQNLPSDLGGTTTTTPESTGTPAEVPDTGSHQVFILSVAGALMAFGAYYTLDSREKALAKFERRSIKN